MRTIDLDKVWHDASEFPQDESIILIETDKLGVHLCALWNWDEFKSDYIVDKNIVRYR